MFKNESEAEELVVSSLEKKFGLLCKRQVQINGKKPDIIAYESVSDSLIGIEIKLKDWKKGLYQSYLNKNLVDYSYLCMPNNYYNLINNRMNGEFEKIGIGFMEIYYYNQDIHLKKRAEKNIIEKSRKEEIKKQILKEEENEHLL
jgi:hypothetical protein